MGVRIASAASTAIVSATPANAQDAVLFTVGPIGLIQDNAQVFLQWYFTVLTGVGATNYNVRLRRGATNASQLINVNVATNILASSTVVYSGCYIDSPGIAGPLQYCITGIVTGGAAGVTIGDGCLMAMVL